MTTITVKTYSDGHRIIPCTPYTVDVERVEAGEIQDGDFIDFGYGCGIEPALGLVGADPARLSLPVWRPVRC